MLTPARVRADAFGMDLGDPISLLSGLILCLAGMGLIMYAKKNQQLAPAVAGLTLCVMPYLVASLILNWVIAGACFGGLYVLSRNA